MRAIVSAPTEAQHIEFREVDEPRAARNEAMVATRAVSLNRGNFRRLTWEKAGWIPGYDVAGMVAQAAADGSGPAVGARVAGFVPEGAWAEMVAVPTRQLAVIPEGVDYAAAAAIPVAALTALTSLAHGGVLLGKRVLITGAAGGVGRSAIQLAALAGAIVTAQVGRPERAKGLRELGASAIALTLEEDDTQFDLVIESIGGALLGHAIRRLAVGGTVVCIGASSDEPTTFDPLSMVRKGSMNIYGLTLFHEMERQGMGSRELAYLLALVASGKLDPQIDVQQSWREMGMMLEALGNRQIAGKAIALVD